MYIAYVCTGPDIPVFGTKGASVHIQDVTREPVRHGRNVEIHAVYMGDHVPADPVNMPTVEYPLDTDDADDRGRVRAQASHAIA